MEQAIDDGSESTLKQREKALTEELARLQQENKNLEEQAAADPEYRRLGEAFESAQKAFEAVNHTLREMRKAAANMVLNRERYGGQNPRYDNPTSTNIRPEVIAAMKKHIPLSALTSNQVEGIANDLITRFMEADPAYAAAKAEFVKASAQKRVTGSDYFDYVARYAGKPTHDIEKELNRVKALLANPASARAAERRMRIKESIPEKTATIFEELRAAARGANPPPQAPA
ncbi:MAG: hypothetical protein JRM77_03765 [Nitrososphaerota archaeon]|jgi:hypothetical protein|nr:hypothetical protein [Nitrososphaerota archaeon]